MSKKDTFVFNAKWYDVIKVYPAETRLEVIEAILCYASTGEVPQLGAVANVAFGFIKMEMDYNAARYDAIVERRRAAGRKSAMVKSQAKAASVNSVEQNQQSSTQPTSVNHNDNDNDNDNENVNDNDSKIEKENVVKEIFESEDCACGAVPVEFEEFRKAYPGRKNAAEVEFDNLKTRFPEQWQQIVPLLKPALERMMSWRTRAKAAGAFVPQFKNLRTWINQQCWTEEYPEIAEAAAGGDRLQGDGAVRQFTTPRRGVAPGVDPVKEEERRRRNAEADALDALRVRYERRVRPSDRHLINFNQYRYLHFDTATDDHLAETIRQMRRGVLRLPSDVREMFGFTHDFKPLKGA